MDRISDQVGGIPKLKLSGTLRVAAEKLPASSAGDSRTLEEQVWNVADYITETIQQGLCTKKEPTEEEKYNNAH
jgi:hypothetical protein